MSDERQRSEVIDLFIEEVVFGNEDVPWSERRYRILQKTNICPVCGKEFISPKRYYPHCSEKCHKYAAWLSSIARLSSCIVCGRIFQAKNSEATCSLECKGIWDNQFRSCVVCGKRFLKNGVQKTCSPECKRIRFNRQVNEYYHRKAKKALKPSRDRVCVVCGKTNLPKNNQKICSPECKRIWTREKWRENYHKRKEQYCVKVDATSPFEI